jgi:hypothetical protein
VIKPWVFIYNGNYPRQGISANVILGGKYEKGKEKKRKMLRKKEKRKKIKGNLNLKG